MKQRVIKKQSGFGMIEVLVAVLVLSVGVIGMAALQMQTLKSSNEASQRSVALLVARSVISQMRSNAGGAQAYVGAYSGADCDGGAPNSCTGGANCTEAQLAAFDAYSTMCGSGGSANSGMGEQIPDATVTVTCNPAPCDFIQSVVTVDVDFTARRNQLDSAGADRTQRVSLSTRL